MMPSPSSFPVVKTSVGDIAEEAGVSRATAYLYFASKEVMVLGWVERREKDRLARLRQIAQPGGSFGIAILSTYITQKTEAHYSYLAENAYSGNPYFDERWQSLTGGLIARGYDAAMAHTAALGMITEQVRRQAMTISYNEAFLLIGVSVVLVSPLVFLLRTKRPVVPSAAADMH